MGAFDRNKDDQLEEILRQIREKRQEEDRLREIAKERKTVLTSETVEFGAPMSETAERNTQFSAARERVEETEIRDIEIAVDEKQLSLEPLVHAKEAQPDKGTPFFSTDRFRSLKDAFSGHTDTIPTDEINRRMLTQQLLDEEEETNEGTLDSMEEMRRIGSDPEKHPLFRVTGTMQILIPEEEKAPLRETEESKTKKRVFLQKESKEIEKKGVLNVKENVDDEQFKTFFSNTVVIDAPLHQRRMKPKRITDFVVGDNGGPVFADETEAETDVREYRSDDETDEVMEDLRKKLSSVTTRLFLTGAVSFVLLVFYLLVSFRILLPDSMTGNMVAVSGANFLLMLATVLLSAKHVMSGLVGLVTFRATEDSLVAFAAAMALLESPLLLLLSGTTPGFASVVASFALFFSLFGRRITAKRILHSFKYIASDYEKFATTVLPDDAFSRRLTREIIADEPRILIKRKTGFTDDFLAHAHAEDHVNETARRPAPILFLGVLAAAVASYFVSGSAPFAVSAAALSATLIAPFSSTLASALPFDRMQSHLARISCVVPGFSAADELVEANCIVLEGRELFPKGNVLLHGIKTFERKRIDKAILYAASVLIQSCDTMSHMFLNVIQNKTEMLYAADNILYEDGLGFSCWIGQTRLLIGTRELLESRDIEVPSRDYENRYTKSSTRDAIYLAVSGQLYAMFVVSYAPNQEVQRAMRGFMQENISILIRTRDFNITAEKISRLYGVPRAMISVVSDHDMEEIGRRTSYVGHTPSLSTHLGTLSSYAGGILASHNLQKSLRLSTTVQLAAMLVGAVLAILFCLIKSLGITPLVVLAYQMIWLAVTGILVNLRGHS